MENNQYEKLRNVKYDRFLSGLSSNETFEQDYLDISKCVKAVCLATSNPKRNRFSNSERIIETTDKIFLGESDDNNGLFPVDVMKSATDYAKANGVRDGGINGEKTAAYWTRSSCAGDMVDIIDNDGQIYYKPVNADYIGLAPEMHLGVKEILELQKKYPGMCKIDARTQTIEFGVWPKTALHYDLDESLVIPTGKVYTGYLQSNGEYVKNSEYVSGSDYYVHAHEIRGRKNGWSHFINEPSLNTGWGWYKLEWITHEIKNWIELPKSINPNGLGIANEIIVQTKDVIMGGIPFYPNNRDKNRSLWQNSAVRGFLNGINVCKIQDNGISSHTAANGGDFSRQGYLREAFLIPMGFIKLRMLVRNNNNNKQGPRIFYNYNEIER